jgi:hypothetical protein
VTEDLKQPNESFVEFKVFSNDDIIVASNSNTPSKKLNFETEKGSPVKEFEKSSHVESQPVLNPAKVESLFALSPEKMNATKIESLFALSPEKLRS